MRSTRFWASRIVAPLSGLFLTGLLIACDQTEPRGPGAIRISAMATLAEPSFFQYSIAIDSGTPWKAYAGVPLTVLQAGLAHGLHRVTVSDVPLTCAGRNPREVTLAGDDTARVSITITCPRTTGDLSINVTTTGSDLDQNGYFVLVDGATRAFAAPNGSVVISSVSVGTHTVSLTDIASNCTFGGSQTANVAAATITTVSLSVTCTPVAALRFVASVTGSDRDPDGYSVLIDNQPAGQVSASQTTTLRLAPGTHSWVAGDVQPNCTVSGSTSGSVIVAAGDTAVITLAEACTAIPIGAVGVAVTDPAADTITSSFSGPTTPHDVLGVTARYAPGWIIMVIRFAKPVISNSGLDPQALYGFIELNADESAATGATPASNRYGASAGSGVDYVVSFSSDSVSALIFALSGTTLGATGRVRTKYEGDSVIVQIPLNKLGGDDGNMAIVMTLGTKDRPTDVVPNSGVILARVPSGSIQASSVALRLPQAAAVVMPGDPMQAPRKPIDPWAAPRR